MENKKNLFLQSSIVISVIIVIGIIISTITITNQFGSLFRSYMVFQQQIARQNAVNDCLKIASVQTLNETTHQNYTAPMQDWYKTCMVEMGLQ